jgi:outer membrane protein TolC
VLTAEGMLLQARRQMAAINAQLATQRVALLLSIGGGVAISESGQAGQGRGDDR